MKLLDVIKKIFIAIGIVCLVVLGIGLCIVAGYIIRWLVWLFCFIIEIGSGSNAVIRWIANHDTAMHIICSCLAPVILVVSVICASTPNNSNNNKSNNYKDDNNNFNYEKEVKEMKRNSFSFVDCSGCHRHWGDSFIDHKGNWCSWGSGFYDYDDNYIHWGNTYKDSSGAYRHWGDDFVDCAGDYVHIP